MKPRTASVLIVAGLVLVGISSVGVQPVRASAAGINQTINYQGRLLNNAGAVIADGNYNMRFKIYQDGDGLSANDATGSPAGSLKWTEDWLVSNTQGVTVKNGYFSVNLGSINAFGASVNWNWDTLYLSQTVVSGANATAACGTFTACNTLPELEMLPMKRLSSAVYALQAQTCTTCILQGPTSTAQNTISPNVNATAVVGLTVNGNTGTSGAAQAVQVNQSQAADGVDIAVSNATGTATNGLSVAMSGAGTLTNGIQISRSAGTLSTGLLFSGAIGTEIKLQNSESIANGTNGTITLASDSGALILNLSDAATSATITNNTGNLILDSASNTLAIAASDTTLQRAASGTYAIDLLDAGADTTLSVTNSDATRKANLSVEGIVTVGGGATKDVTTAAAGTSAALTIAPGDSTTPSIAGSSLTLRGSNETGGTGATGGNLVLQGGTGTTAATNGAVQIGTANTLSVSIGSNGNSTNTVSIDAGTGANGIAIGNSAAAHQIAIGNASGANNTTIGIGNGTTGVSNTAVIAIGSNNAAASTTTINGGNGSTAITLQTASGGNINLSPAGTGDVVITQPAGSQVQITASAASTVDQLAITNSGQASTTTGVDGISVTFGTSGASGDALHVVPSFTSATTAITYNVMEADPFTATNTTGTDLVNGLKLGNLTEAGAGVITSSALNIGSGWDNVLMVNGTAVINGSGVVQIAGGGTGATTAQAAINGLSGLTTTGDLLYYNGTNSTRLARGSNGDCLTTNTTTIVWGACSAGATTALDNLASVAINTDLQFKNTANRTINIAQTGASTNGRSLTLAGGAGGTGDSNGGDIVLQGGAGGSTSGSSGSVLVNNTNSPNLGTLWTTNANTFTGRYGLSSATGNGYMYALGGQDGSSNPMATVEYSKINADGSLGTWSATTSLPAVRAVGGAVFYNGFVYYLAGEIANDAKGYATVYYAKQNADGTLGSWNTTTSLPGGRAQFSTALVNGYVYIMGGTDGAGSTVSTVYYAKFNSDGSLGSWSTTTAFNAVRMRQTSVAANGYIYSIGGNDGVTPELTTVEYAKVNADGTLGAWTSAGNNLVTSKSRTVAAVLNGYIYAIGGFGNNGTESYTAYYAAINSAGTVGAWTQTTSLTGTATPLDRRSATAQVVNGYIYVMGGENGGLMTDQVYNSPARVKMGGSLDLLAYDGKNLADTGGGGSGGSLTAGNTYVAGTLNVTEAATFGGTLGVNGSLTAGGLAVRPTADSQAGFQVADKSGNPIVNVNTTDTGNLLSNGNFENGNAVTTVPGWTKSGTPTTYQTDTSTAQFASTALKLVTTTTASQGATSTYAFRPDTTYTLSVYAKGSGTMATQFQIGATVNGSAVTGTGCSANITLTASFVRSTCVFTTGSTTTATDSVFFKSGEAAVRTFWVDGFQLEVGGAATPYSDPAFSATNLVANSSFENGNTNGWAAHGAVTSGPSPSTAFAKFGNYSLNVSTGAATDKGADYRYPFAPTTTYSLSMWVRLDTASATNLIMGYYDGTTSNDCAVTSPDMATVGVTTTWTQFSCTFTTGATVGATSAFYLRTVTTATARVFYVDGVTLVQAPNGLSFAQPAGAIQVDNQTNNLVLNGNNSGDLQTWRLNPNPLGATSATDATNRVIAREDAASVIANGYVYDIAGFDGTNTLNSVAYARMNADGSLGTWSCLGTAVATSCGTSASPVNSNNVPAALRYPAATVANGYVYVVGGASSAGVSSANIYFAKLNSDGSVGSWQTNAVTLPTARYGASVVVSNGIMYVLGGCTGTDATLNCATPSNVNYYGKMNADGSVSGVTSSATLTSSAQNLTAARGMGTAVFANGNIYYIGGYNAGIQSTVYYAAVTPGGDLVSWISTGASLPAVRREQGTVVADGYLYVLGGCTTVSTGVCTAASSSIFYAKLNGDGTWGSWQTAADSLPAGRASIGSIIANGYIYILGGFDGSSRYSSVYFASTPRTLIGGSLDLVGLSSQSLSDYGGAGALTAGNGRFIGDLKVDGFVDLNNGLSVDSALNINAVSGTLGQVIFNINNSNSNSIFSIKHMATNFGALATTGAFISKNNYWGEEFNVTQTNNCNRTTTTNGWKARGDYGNNIGAGCTAGNGELALSSVLGVAASTNKSEACSSNTATACGGSIPSAMYGLERISATSSGTASNTAATLEYLSSLSVGGTAAGFTAANNLPVFTAKVKPSLTASGSFARFFVGLGDKGAASGLFPTNGVFFSNCTATAVPACAGTNWIGVVTTTAGGVVGTVTCNTAGLDNSGNINTTSFNYLRIEVRSNTDVHFFVDTDTSNGISEKECGAGITATGPAATGLSPMLESAFMTASVTTENLDVDFVRIWQDDPPAGDSPQTAAFRSAGGGDAPLVPDVAPGDRTSWANSQLVDFTAATNEDAIFDHDVYVKGTLYADKIKANQIEGLDVLSNNINSLQAKLAAAGSTSASTSAALASPGLNLSGLQIGSSAVPFDLNVNGGLLVGGAADFRGNAFFRGLVTFVEKTVFNNDVSFQGRATFNNDTAGFATIYPTQKEVQVTFDKPYDQTPVVVVSMRNGLFEPFSYTDLTPTGFKIVVPKEATQQMDFSWYAVSVKDAKMVAVPTPSPSPSGSPSPAVKP